MAKRATEREKKREIGAPHTPTHQQAQRAGERAREEVAPLGAKQVFGISTELLLRCFGARAPSHVCKRDASSIAALEVQAKEEEAHSNWPHKLFAAFSNATLELKRSAWEPRSDSPTPPPKIRTEREKARERQRVRAAKWSQQLDAFRRSIMLMALTVLIIIAARPPQSFRYRVAGITVNR